MAEQQTELEQQFEKLHQLIQQNQHSKVVKLTDTSKSGSLELQLAVYQPMCSATDTWAWLQF